MMSDKADALKILIAVGAVLKNDHFEYPSGRHGASFINKDALFPHVGAVSQLCELIAEHFQLCRYRGVEVVAGRGVRGMALAQWTAHHLTRLQGNCEPCMAVYADRAEEGEFVFRRGQGKLIAGKNVLIVEDVMVTGESVLRMIELVKHRGNLVGVGVLSDRGYITDEYLGVPDLHVLAELSDVTYAPADCPMCRQGKPLSPTPGSNT